MPYKRILVICKNCKKEFIGNKTRIFCSRNCYNRYREANVKIIVQCRNCKKEFLIYKHRIKWGGGKFCRKQCYNSFPKSKELRERVSLLFRGKNHPRWKGGIMKGRKDRNLFVYKQWRINVFSKDKFTCQKCGLKNHKGLGKSLCLEAHHLKSWTKFPHLRYNIQNGITLCKDCHTDTRRKSYLDKCKT